MSKIKPGITIDEKVWKQFKEKFKENASKEVEKLMSMSLSDNVDIIENKAISNIYLSNSTDWNINYGAQNITINSTSFTSDQVDVQNYNAYFTYTLEGDKNV